MGTCPLEMTQQQLDDIRQCEAVVVREYETDGGRRFAHPVAWGDADEMRDAAETRGLFIIPVGVKIIGQQCLMVAELLGSESA